MQLKKVAYLCTVHYMSYSEGTQSLDIKRVIWLVWDGKNDTEILDGFCEACGGFCETCDGFSNLLTHCTQKVVTHFTLLSCA